MRLEDVARDQNRTGFVVYCCCLPRVLVVDRWDAENHGIYVVFDRWRAENHGICMVFDRWGAENHGIYHSLAWNLVLRGHFQGSEGRFCPWG